MKLAIPQALGFVYFVSELLLTVTRRARVATGEKQDRGTLRILWLVIGFSIAAGIYATFHWRAAAVSNYALCATIGLVLFLGGLILRWWAIVALGRFFTVDVQIAGDHQVVTKGPFAVMRHPSYTGALLAFAGFALSLGNWASWLIIMIPVTAAFFRRIEVEEAALTRALGENYLSYSRRTKRLIPGVY